MVRKPNATDWWCMAGIGAFAGWLPVLAAPWLTRLDSGIIDAEKQRFLHLRRNGWSPLVGNGQVHEFPLHEIESFAVYSFNKRRGAAVKWRRDLKYTVETDPRRGKGWSLKPMHVIILRLRTASGIAPYVVSPAFDRLQEAEAPAAALNAGLRAARLHAGATDPAPPTPPRQPTQGSIPSKLAPPVGDEEDPQEQAGEARE